MSVRPELYEELILDHYRQPRNRGTLPQADGQAEGYNPLCGDQVRVFVKLSGDVIEKVAFEGAGCAISTASASLMTEAVQGKTVAETRALFERFHHLVTQGAHGVPLVALGKLAAFSNVSRYPARVKCATLAWHALDAALRDSERARRSV